MRLPHVLVTALVTLALLAASQPATADPGGPAGLASPTTFTYQGQLTGSSGPVTGTCAMIFLVYDAPSGGTRLGPSIFVSVSVTAGLFTQPLDFGPGVFTGGARWLDIQVKCGAETTYTPLSPRQPLTAAPYALALPGLYTQPNAISPNVIGGYSGNSVAPLTVGAVIAGGGSAGFTNTVTGTYGVIGGGDLNTVSARQSVVSGGETNLASGDYSVVGGGSANVSAAEVATVSGGESNTASGVGATVPGGSQNTAGGLYSFAAGFQARALADGAFVWADSSPQPLTSTVANEFLVRATGGLSVVTAVNGGGQPTAGLFVSPGGAATVNGLQVGSAGTLVSQAQSGTANVGGSGGASLVYTVTFPSTFSALPRVVATARNDPTYFNTDLSDTFVVSVRRLSTTAVVFSIVRVDSASGWSQNLRVDWMAWL